MAKRKNPVVKKSNKQKAPENNSYLNRIENEIQDNQSKVSMVLGALIILVVGILLFNYFNKNNSDLGPAQQIQTDQDVSPDQLPGKYIVKDGDTLFTIAEKYYQDGYKYTEIVKANNLTNADQIETGQVLEIPKLDSQTTALTSPEPSPTVQPSAEPSVEPSVQPSAQPEASQTPVTDGSGANTDWGTKIEGNTYTVVAGDWLSTIAGRAYGDIMAFDRIAKANNISNPDAIEPGTVLNLPR